MRRLDKRRERAGIEDWVRDLSAREKACCPFFAFAVTAAGGEVWWDIAVPEGDIAGGRILDDLYGIPDTIGDGVAGMEKRFAAGGLTVIRRGAVMEVHPTGS